MKIKDKERANRIIEIYKDVNLNQKKICRINRCLSTVSKCGTKL